MGLCSLAVAVAAVFVVLVAVDGSSSSDGLKVSANKIKLPLPSIKADISPSNRVHCRRDSPTRHLHTLHPRRLHRRRTGSSCLPITIQIHQLLETSQASTQILQIITGAESYLFFPDHRHPHPRHGTVHHLPARSVIHIRSLACLSLAFISATKTVPAPIRLAFAAVAVVHIRTRGIPHHGSRGSQELCRCPRRCSHEALRLLPAASAWADPMGLSGVLPEFAGLACNLAQGAPRRLDSISPHEWSGSQSWRLQLHMHAVQFPLGWQSQRRWLSRDGSKCARVHTVEISLLLASKVLGGKMFYRNFFCATNNLVNFGGAQVISSLHRAVCSLSLAAQSSTVSGHFQVHRRRPCSKPPDGREEDVQLHSIDYFQYIFSSMKKKNPADFLGPFKPTHSAVPFGKLLVTIVGVLVNFWDPDVTRSSFEDRLVIWLL